MSKNRFGISLYSKKNYSSAYNEEVMIDKNTGEILIKTQNGDIRSYDYSSKLTSNINNLKKIANNKSIYGNIVNIEFDSIAPFKMEFNKNYISTPIDIDIKCKRILFNLDIDALSMSGENTFTIDKNNVNVSIDIGLIYLDNTISDTYTIDIDMNNLNNEVYTLNDNSIIKLPYNKIVKRLQIQSFKVNDIYVDHKGDQSTLAKNIDLLFNSLLLVIE